jgi:iron complex outermembrane receptor protein
VEVGAGLSVSVNAELEAAEISLAAVSVYAASLRQERITEAPAAVSVIEPQDIKLNGGSGQLPRLLESEPGVDIVQSGMQDFNINTRGFNSSLNRRLLVLMDGRDLAVAFLGAQEWNGLSVPLDDLGRLELVRGPGSALYGPNAFNGVINIGTPAPRDVLGTKFSYSMGELNLVRADLRQAALLGNGWSYKANVGISSSQTWSKSRTAADTNAHGEFEYDGLRKSGIEARPLDTDPLRSIYGSARVDYNYSENSVATFEGGLTQVENELFVTGIGRVQVTKALKPWARISMGTGNLNINIWGEGRNSIEPQYSLASGAPLEEKSEIYHAEAQYNFEPIADELRIIFGASHRYYHVDTDSTLMAAEHYDNTSGLFGQAEYAPSSVIKFVAATRWDRSTLHTDQVSPKGAIVWTPSANHSLRATVNRAFQVPNYSEFFLQADAGTANLPFFRTPSNPTGETPILARGNAANTVETIVGYELGYKGIYLNDRFFFSLDAYYNRAENFVTDLLQGVNPAYPFLLPPGFPAGLADLARQAVPGLTLINGQPAIVLSYTNAGKVDEQGTETGINFYATDELLVSGSWTWYDFIVKEQQAGDVLLPNAPKHKFSFGATWRSRAGYEIGINGRNIQPFHWSAGVYDGDIPAYTLVNVSAGYQITQNVRLGATVSNALDHKVYEIFGGSVIGRQAIGTFTLTF